MEAAYQYSGQLKALLEEPTPEELADIDSVTFEREDLMRWTTRDLPYNREWKRVPVQRTRGEAGVRLIGRFEEVHRIDRLPADIPAIWVAIGTRDLPRQRLPIELERYPVIEVTYRCLTDNARPAMLWAYPGGTRLNWLPLNRRWTVNARQICFFGEPKRIDDLFFRLYSPSRSAESVEIASVRFRAFTERERQAVAEEEVRLREHEPPKRYACLDEFMPLGVYADAEVARRLAEMLGVTLDEYWTLAMEDMVKHHHNCVALQNAGRMNQEEFRSFVDSAGRFGLKTVPLYEYPIGASEEHQRQFVDHAIRPYADSDTILAWHIVGEPQEREIHDVFAACERIEQADPHHPVAVIAPHFTSFHLYAPFFPASGMRYFRAHSSHGIADVVRGNLPAVSGQQFWMTGPAFVYATSAPEWSTCPEMRQMVNLSFANGVRGWFSYAFHNDPAWLFGSVQRSLTGPFLAFSDLWLELDKRMERFAALAPLLLETAPAPLPDPLFASAESTGDNPQVPEGLPPVAFYHLAGPDYSLLFAVNNDTRGMSAVNVRLPREALEGREVHDLTDFVYTRRWTSMDLQRHVEMFPGQAHVVLLAQPETSARLRDALAERLIEDDQNQLRFDLQLARAYGLDVGGVEDLLASVGADSALKNLAIMDRARDMLIDITYGAPGISEARTRIIQSHAALCGCDGALCRLLDRDETEQARDLGQKVLPLAREATQLRLEMRSGRGQAILAQTEDLCRRTRKLLDDIRAASS